MDELAVEAAHGPGRAAAEELRRRRTPRTASRSAASRSDKCYQPGGREVRLGQAEPQAAEHEPRAVPGRLRHGDGHLPGQPQAVGRAPWSPTPTAASSSAAALAGHRHRHVHDHGPGGRGRAGAAGRRLSGLSWATPDLPQERRQRRVDDGRQRLHRRPPGRRPALRDQADRGGRRRRREEPAPRPAARRGPPRRPAARSSPTAGGPIRSAACRRPRRHRTSVEADAGPADFKDATKSAESFAKHSFGAVFAEVHVDPAPGHGPGAAAGRGVRHRPGAERQDGPQPAARRALVFAHGMALLEDTAHRPAAREPDPQRQPTPSTWCRPTPTCGAVDVILVPEEDDPHVNPIGVKGDRRDRHRRRPRPPSPTPYIHATGKRVRDLPITPDKLL